MIRNRARLVLALFYSFFLILFSASFAQAQSGKEESSKWAESPDVEQKAAQWWARRETAPAGASRALLRRQALQQLDDMIAQQKPAQKARASSSRSARASAQSSSGSWQPIGPAPIGFEVNDFTSGRVNSIAVDPRNSSVVFAGTDSGGVWKTTDGGTNWKPLTDSQPSLAITTVAIDPNSPDTVWAATGPGQGNGFGFEFGAGLLKSTDGGATWASGLGPDGTAVGEGLNTTSLAVQPGNSNVLLITANCSICNSGVFRSSDGGATWTKVLDTPTSFSATFAPSGSVAYVSAQPPGSACCKIDVFKSVDGGATWSNISAGQPFENGSDVLIQVAPSNPSTVYVIGSSIAKSTDAGSHWTSLPNPGAGAISAARVALGVSPVDPNLVFVGGVSPFRSLDGGQSWQGITDFHADYHAFSFSATGDKLYVGNDGGVFGTSSPSAANLSFSDWSQLNTTFQTALMYPGLSVDDNDPTFSLVGTQDNGSILYSGSNLWSLVECGDGGATAKGSAGVYYLLCAAVNTSHTLIFKSTGGTHSFASAENGIPPGELSNFLAPLTVDPSNRDRLYWGGIHVWQTQNAAANWRAISPAFSAELSAMAVAPSDPNVVYAAVPDQLPIIEVTNNALSSSPTFTTAGDSGLFAQVVTALAVDFQNPQTVYATLGGYAGGQHVFKSTNAGANWTNITGSLPNVPTNDIALDPDVPGTIYVADDIGVFVSTDSGSTWSPLVNGLPRVPVTSLRMIHGSRILRAGTYGRGAFDLQLAGATTADFALTAAPTSATVSQGQSASLTVNVTGSNGFNGSVMLSASGLPTGATASFATNPVSGTGATTLTVSTSATTPAGNYTVNISGSSGALTHSASVQLTVTPAGTADFSVTATPASATASSAQSASYSVNVAAQNGFSGNVALSATGLPAGATASFAPSTVVGSGTSALTVTLAASTPPGNYTLNIVAGSGTLSHSATVALTVIAATAADFSISATPPSAVISPGQNASYSISIAALNGFTANVAFSVAGLPQDATAAFSPAQIAASGSAMMTVNAGANTPPGDYALTITGTSASLVHSASVKLSVSATPMQADFAMSLSPPSATVAAGKTASYSVTLTPENGFNGTVQFACAGLPAQAACAFSPAQASSGMVSLQISTAGPSAGLLSPFPGSGRAVFALWVTLASVGPFGFLFAGGKRDKSKIALGCVLLIGLFTLACGGGGGKLAGKTPSGGTPTGTYNITVTGTSGSLQHSAQVSLIVQ